MFYSATSPATGGTKVNTATSPAIATAGNGTYHVTVAAVSAVGDGATATETVVTLDGLLHDTLFAEADPNVAIFDCYSHLADQATPTRTLTTGITFDDAGMQSLAVDPVYGTIWRKAAATPTTRRWTAGTTPPRSTARSPPTTP